MSSMLRRQLPTSKEAGQCSFLTVGKVAVLLLFFAHFSVYSSSPWLSGTTTGAASPTAGTGVDDAAGKRDSGGATNSSPSSSCSTDGQMTLHRPVVLEAGAIQNHDTQRIDAVKQFTFVNYEKFIMSPAGTEHYKLLNYLTNTFGDDCRHVVDIGTRYVASSLALGSSQHHNRVWTFDLPTSTERRMAFRGKSEAEWQQQVKAAGVDITFHNLDLLAVPDDDFRRYMSTWLIMLDTAHLPDTVPFEREFFQRLKGVGYQGLMLLDDIYLNNEMKKWWKELQDGAASGGYRTYDITAVGHFSGTGLVDFSDRTTVNI